MAQSASKPLISVLMPAFNVEQYVGPAIESVLKQSFTNFELIVLDDGSSDSTANIIDTYSDPRLTKIFLAANKGLVNARNTLVAAASGKYIAFLDSDDLADPNRLELQLQYLQSNQLDLCGTDHLVLHQNSGKTKSSKQRHSDADIRAMISVCSPLCNPSVMGRADIFKNTPYLTEGNDGAEDYLMWIHLALAGCKFGNVPRNLITYRIHEQQISQVQSARANSVFEEYRKYYVKALGINEELLPRKLPWLSRLKIAPRFLFDLNKIIPEISFAANYQIYSRYQFRGNGFWTPFTRLERALAAAIATIIGQFSNATH